ncbi:MAG: DNA-binding protein, partial [Clostridium sp.]|nr:DNA-binding protein [Clostridium sp.]
MNKAELISALAESTNSTKKDSEVFLKAFLDTVVGTLEKGEKVQLVGFGTFEVRDR